MQTICVQKCKLGSTEYYLAKMPAGELVDTVGLAAEMPEWEGMTADEKMQREPDINRVVNEISFTTRFISGSLCIFSSAVIPSHSGISAASPTVSTSSPAGIFAK